MTADQEVFNRWMDLGEAVKLLRPRMMVKDPSWVLDDFSARKYLNLRLDMRVGLVYILPGNAEQPGNTE